MLKIQFKDRRKPAMWLVDSRIRIGSDPKCELQIDESSVDPIHCELLVDQDVITLTNRSKSRSVFVNEIPVVSSQALKAWDIIRVGASDLEIIDPLSQDTRPAANSEANKTIIRPAVSDWMLKANTVPFVGQFFPISSGFIIGRDESADIVIPLSFVSRSHAKLTIKQGVLKVEDTKSSNGTFVNGTRVKTETLANGDDLRLDEFSFTVIGPDKARTKKQTAMRNKKAASEKAKRSTSQLGQKNALASSKVFLHDIDKNSTGKVYEIIRKENHLSKMLGHHLSTSDKSVSARHVHLTETEVGWEIVNNGAADGLLVNNNMLIRAVLQDGDEVTVGGTLLKFQSIGDTPRNYYRPRQSNGLMSKGVILFAVAVVLAAVGVALGWF